MEKYAIVPSAFDTSTKSCPHANGDRGCQELRVLMCSVPPPCLIRPRHQCLPVGHIGDGWCFHWHFLVVSEDRLIFSHVCCCFLSFFFVIGLFIILGFDGFYHLLLVYTRFLHMKETNPLFCMLQILFPSLSFAYLSCHCF